MRFTLVGNRRGRREVVWSEALKLLLILTPVPGLLVGAIYFLVAKRWSNDALLLGFCAGPLTAVLAVLASFCTPIYRLPRLPDNP